MGLALGIGAYLWWGALPLYLATLAPAQPAEIIAHRVLWSVAFCVILLTLMRNLKALGQALRVPRTAALLGLAAVLIAANWTVYVFGVLAGHVIDAALGYFINPLITVILAVFVLSERLRPVQWIAVGIGALAVAVITAGIGRFPWIAITLAVTFGVYGLIKNRVGRDVAALPGMAAETTLLAPVALGYLGWLAATGRGTFTTDGVGHALLLMAAGVVTAVPLVAFGAAARRLPLSIVGLLQYLAPVLQFLAGLLVFHEPMPAVRWVGFGLVWLALALLTFDALRAARTTRLAAHGASLTGTPPRVNPR